MTNRKLVRSVVWALAAVVTLALTSGGGHDGPHRAEAADPNLEFEMEAKGGQPVFGSSCTTTGIAPIYKYDAVCSFPVNSTFTVSVQLTNPGAVSGQVTGWQAVISWTPGLVGPGDPSSTKPFGFRNNGCKAVDGIKGNAAPVLGLPHTAGTGCAAYIPPVFTDAEATGLIADFQLNCGAKPSKELVTMRVGTGTDPPNRPGDNTYIKHYPTGAAHVDKDGSEVITIFCLPPPEQININVSLPVVGKLPGTCWQLS